MTDVSVRPERAEDREGIHGIHRVSFPSVQEADLVDALRDAGELTISLVAEDETGIVGHVAFSPVRLAGTDDGLGLAPVAVRPESRRRGIAARLIRSGLEACAARGCAFVVLLGDPAYYARFGFVAARRFGLRDEYGGGEAFQALELRERAIPEDGGLVRYAESFRIFNDAS